VNGRIGDAAAGFSSRPSRRRRPASAEAWALVVVHAIMDRHDGPVPIYSQPRDATLFRPTPTLSMARILLIDDDDSVRTMLHLTLAHFGHTVIEARNGKEGLELFQHANADLLITDIMMPEKEGLEVLMELRKKHPPVKIIAISGGDYLHMAKLMGAAKVLAKPFSTNVLIEAIDELLPGGGASVRSPVAQ
jgi:CheY-like chemotaxis protein